MSLVRDMAAVGQLATADYEEEVCKNLRTGLSFRAKVQPIADMELNTELGRDAREAVTLHLRDRDAAAAQNMGDKIEAIGQTFQIVRRTDNPATVHVEFGCIEIASVDS